MINLPNGLFDFQEACSLFLVDKVGLQDSKQTITVKAPTGAGKTVILIDFIDKFLSSVNSNTAFIWLCPGKGDLEEQSRQKMISLLPNRRTNTLNDALLSGFEAGSTTFINWELITKKGNKAISDTEKKNLYDRIAEGNRKKITYIIIVDEEHSNDTKKANDIINAFSAKNIIRVSATAKENKLYEFYEIDEIDVISSGLITKALYINEDVEYDGELESEYGYLLEIADKKRKQIAQAYSLQDGKAKTIRPLVIIQFPNSSDRLVEAVEKKLEEMNYTYKNQMVAKWFSDQKENLDGITELNATPIFLLMKQAIATGWDCPRAKILVKLRENMAEDFEIQTIGRLRRMPEAKHYDIDILDFCYLFTFDEKYKEGIKLAMSQAFETKRVFLKDKCKVFTLEKQYRDKDVGGLGERETFKQIYKFLVDKYKLSGNKQENRLRLEGAGYNFNEKIIGKMLEGKFITTDSVFSEQAEHYRQTTRTVNTHKHGIELLHSVDVLKSTIGMTTQKTKVILERLFRKSVAVPNKLLSLGTAEYYAFVINNEHKLKSDFREAVAMTGVQQSLVFAPKTATFRIPEQELYRYDSTETDVEEFISNAYKDYSSAMIVEGIRSKSERLFERYCEEQEDIEWVYKNGDTGQQYFSVCYMGVMNKQWLFYPDYIVKKTNGDIWIIETKGGEIGNQSKNIDNQVENKFASFKQYAEKHGIKWGFVRDKNDKLYINNSEYTDDMATEHWKPLKDNF
ncbi:MAG: DNA helicase [Ruminococcaceae bacterium]|nr:DNA helicase [Oscillospiraceae bacterium]